MKFIKHLTAVLLTTASLSTSSAQIHWKKVISVEEFYQVYPERLIFMFNQINLDRKGLESVKQYYEPNPRFVPVSSRMLTSLTILQQRAVRGHCFGDISFEHPSNGPFGRYSTNPAIRSDHHVVRDSKSTYVAGHGCLHWSDQGQIKPYSG